jgi:hypothetical protein
MITCDHPTAANVHRGEEGEEEAVNTATNCIETGTQLLKRLSIHLWLYSPLLNLGHFFSFLILYTAGRTPWRRDQPIARPLCKHRTTQTQNKRIQTSMARVGFEPMIPAFERGHCDRRKCLHHILNISQSLDNVQHNYDVMSHCSIRSCFKSKHN